MPEIDDNKNRKIPKLTVKHVGKCRIFRRNKNNKIFATDCEGLTDLNRVKIGILTHIISCLKGIDGFGALKYALSCFTI